MTARTIIKISGAALICLYVAGYVAARQASWVVHRAGFYTDAAHKRVIAGHDVVPGDFGAPALASGAATVQALVAAIYLPARAAEAAAWRVVVPAGSEWPSHWEVECQTSAERHRFFHCLPAVPRSAR